MKDMKAVILVGGKGTRLRPLTYSIPKPMLPVGDKPFLEYQIEQLKKFNITEIVLCSGYLSNIIEEYFKDGSAFGVNIEYSHEKEELGTGGAIKNAQKYIDGKFMVLNGDSYLKIDYSDFIEYSKTKKSKYTIALTEVEDSGRYGAVEVDSQNKIKKFLEKTEGKIISLQSEPLNARYAADKSAKETMLVNAGTYLFETEIFDVIPEGKVSLEKEIFPKLTGELYGYTARGYFIDMGIPESYEKIKRDIHKIC